MSNRSTLRIPLTIPLSLQDKPYTVKFALHEIDDNGSYDSGCTVFMEQDFASSDLRDGQQPNKKVVVLNRSSIPKLNPQFHGDKTVGLKVSSLILKSSQELCANNPKAYIWKGSKVVQEIECGQV
jgi:hypothetical protein